MELRVLCELFFSMSRWRLQSLTSRVCFCIAEKLHWVFNRIQLWIWHWLFLISTSGWFAVHNESERCSSLKWQDFRCAVVTWCFSQPHFFARALAVCDLFIFNGLRTDCQPAYDSNPLQNLGWESWSFFSLSIESLAFPFSKLVPGRFVYVVDKFLPACSLQFPRWPSGVLVADC